MADVSTQNKLAKHAVLSYQAVEAEMQPSSQSAAAFTIGLSQSQPNQQAIQNQKHLRPNLGIWNCHVDDGKDGEEESSKQLVDLLLSRVVLDGASSLSKGKKGSESKQEADEHVTPTFLFAVDLSDPAAVYPAVDAMANALVRQLRTSNTKSSGTTSLGKLESTKFGSAPEDNEGSSPAAGGGSISVNLILCSLLPGASASSVAVEGAEGYREKQAQALVHYHLRRYAAMLDCTLIHVGNESISGDKNSASGEDNKGGMQPWITVGELAVRVRDLALGNPPGEEGANTISAGSAPTESSGGAAQDGEEKEDAPATPDASSANSAVYLHSTHDKELIESVLLRNASCAGEWDAKSDPIWVALPPPIKESNASRTKLMSKPTGGDEAWLSKLAGSVVGGMPAAKDSADSSGKDAAKVVAAAPAAADSKKKKDAGGSKVAAGGKKKGTDDVGSFFENLLKKP